jgi:hypothetical protein
MRVLRTAFILAAIAILAPSPPDSETAGALAAREPAPTQLEWLDAAGSAASDMAQFCTRQPLVCDAASYIAVKLEAKAKYSVRLIYEWASESQRQSMPFADTAGADGLMTGSTLELAGIADGGTLLPEDRAIAWRPAPARSGT